MKDLILITSEEEYVKEHLVSNSEEGAFCFKCKTKESDRFLGLVLENNLEAWIKKLLNNTVNELEIIQLNNDELVKWSAEKRSSIFRMIKTDRSRHTISMFKVTDNVTSIMTQKIECLDNEKWKNVISYVKTVCDELKICTGDMTHY